jgi:hypothetical protein
MQGNVRCDIQRWENEGGRLADAGDGSMRSGRGADVEMSTQAPPSIPGKQSDSTEK